ncbi:MAG: tRNA 2-thiocytidine biosynthesis protein TtcA [Coprobacter sp.]|nr:tRNA 2-thiocytidine biosynthesis protein TtcA [Coprobacter sp.]
MNREHSTATEQLLLKLDIKVRKAINDYALIDDGDRILIGLSGGKDSLALVELLARRARIFAPRFSLVAAHIRMANIDYKSDSSALQEHCRRNGVEYVERTTEFDLSTDRRKTPCFLCSWYRRKALFTIAREMGCDKIALGHHQDDILETLLMNMSFQGSFGTMPPRLDMRKFAMSIIRPLCLVPESELVALAQVADYPQQEKICPYEKVSHRPAIRDIMRQLEAVSPQLRGHLWNSMTHIQEEYLPQIKKKE